MTNLDGNEFFLNQNEEFQDKKLVEDYKGDMVYLRYARIWNDYIYDYREVDDFFEWLDMSGEDMLGWLNWSVEDFFERSK